MTVGISLYFYELGACALIRKNKPLILNAGYFYYQSTVPITRIYLVLS